MTEHVAILNSKIRSFFHFKSFWLLFAACSILATLINYRYFSQTFDFVDITIKATKHDVILQAQRIAREQKIGPQSYNSTTYFTSNSHLQHYVELDAGGKDAWKKLIQEGIFHPYTWKVRHYKENELNEVTFIFTPSGEPYGFFETISENLHSKSLKSQEARLKADEFLKSYGIDIKNYYVAEMSEEKKPSDRVDHHITYELLNRVLGEAYYRINVTVAGDKITQLYHFIEVPEKFNRKYANMRSVNDLIATTASTWIMLFYGIVGCIMSLIILLYKRRVSVMPPAIGAALMAIGQGLLVINNIPLFWASYNTAHSSQAYLFNILFTAFGAMTSWFAIYFLSFAAAESLTRLAFPDKLQFWRLLKAPLSNTNQVWGYVWGAYLAVPFDLLYVLVFYTIGSKYFGFWSPTDTLVNPNVMSSLVPAFGSIMKSLSAGFWEECLFRAVPIAGCTLLGEKLGNRKFGMIIGFIMQIIVFGAAHANYPAQPAFVRIIELVVPSCIFGWLYLRFGLLPGIILHFVYDAVLFSLPIFANHSSDSFLQKIIVISCMAFPLLIIMFARMKYGSLSQATEDHTYLNVRISDPYENAMDIDHSHAITTISSKLKTIIMISSIVAIISVYYLVTLEPEVPLLKISKQEAIDISKSALAHLDVPDIQSYSVMTCVLSPNSKNITDKFILETSGKDTYKKLIGTYIKAPLWLVRYAKFEGDIEQRAEEYIVSIDTQGNLKNIAHILSQNSEGAELPESQARELALTFISNHYGISNIYTKEIAASCTKQPHRRDWHFTFQDARYQLQEGETRIGVTICGDEISDSRQFIFIPENWMRNHQDRQQNGELINNIQIIILAFLMLVGLLVHKKNLFDLFDNLKIPAIFGSIYLLLFASKIFVEIPTLLFSAKTTHAIFNQFSSIIMTSSIKIIVFSAIASCVFAYTYTFSTKNKIIPRYYAWLGALILSSMVTCMNYYVSSKYFQSVSIPQFSSANDLSISISVLIQFCLNYAHQNLFLTFITTLWPQNRFSSVLTGLILGLAFTPFIFEISLSLWLIWAILQGIIITLLMETLFVKDISLVPYYTVMPLIITLGSMIINPPYESSTLAAYITIPSILLICLGWSRIMQKIKVKVNL